MFPQLSLVVSPCDTNVLARRAVEQVLSTDIRPPGGRPPGTHRPGSARQLLQLPRGPVSPSGRARFRCDTPICHEPTPPQARSCHDETT